MARTGYPSDSHLYGAISLANARPNPPLTAFQGGAPDHGYSRSPSVPDFDPLPDYSRAIRPVAHTCQHTRSTRDRSARRQRGICACLRQNLSAQLSHKMRGIPIGTLFAESSSQPPANTRTYFTPQYLDQP